jgi:hypothetical protein
VKRTAGWLVVVAVALGLVVVSRSTRAQADRLASVLPKDAIPSIDEPAFERASRTFQYVDDEPVIGVVGTHEQRAYSAWTLDLHEIVNDSLEGQPIAVTWCPLCGTAIVYARTVGTRTLSFGVSGMLFRDALVMYDRETGSLWSQVDGQAIRGTLGGQVLHPVASIQSTWAEWKALYPESLVLTKAGNGGFRSSYETYNRSTRLGVLGTQLPHPALPPKTPVLGVRYDGATMAFAIKDVRTAGLVQVTVGRAPILLASTSIALPIVAFERDVDGRRLTFTRMDDPTVLTDVETHSRWRVADGVAIDGPLTSARLTRVITYPAFWFGWIGFFPRSTLWKP